MSFIPTFNKIVNNSNQDFVNEAPVFRTNSAVIDSLQVSQIIFSGTGIFGSQGPQGKGFIIFTSVSNFNNLCSSNPTSSNIGEFVLITGGDLYLYAGTGLGNTGPAGCPLDWIYSGDITDETQIIGPQGLIGPTGTRGSTGASGIVGSQGPQGLIGSTGAVGPQGLIGSTGAVGPQGLIGSTGAVGPQGLIGSTGAVGPQGLI